MLFPKFSTFKIKGPLKITFLPFVKNDNLLIQSSVDFTKADVYFPALALKKVRGESGRLRIDFTKDNKSVFKYSQSDVLLSGTALHKSNFEIKKVYYSNIKTPDVIIERATFQKFDEYNQFKTDGGTINLEYLMRLNFKKKMCLSILFLAILL